MRREVPEILFGYKEVYLVSPIGATSRSGNRAISTHKGRVSPARTFVFTGESHGPGYWEVIQQFVRQTRRRKRTPKNLTINRMSLTFDTDF